MHGSAPEFLVFLRCLSEHQVDFIVVGGVCAVLHGSPISTFDLDVVHSRQPENIQRLLAALQELGAIYRDLAGRRIVPTASHLITSGHQLLTTSAGDLDVLGTIGKDRDYDDLLAESIRVEIEEGLTVCMLNMPMLIKTKEEANRDKDRAVLPILRRTLEEINRKANEPPEQN